MKIICEDTVSVGLSYDAYSKWHMPICAEICRAEQKYMPFFGTVTERGFRKKNPKHRNIYKTLQCCALDFFFRKRRSVMIPRFGFFFQDSRIRVKSFSGLCSYKILLAFSFCFIFLGLSSVNVLHRITLSEVGSPDE